MGGTFAAELQKIIDSCNPDSKERVAQDIEKLRASGINSFEELASAAKDPSAGTETRGAACWLLGQLGEKRAAGSLLAAFSDPALSWEAAKALGVIKSKRAVKPLIDSLLEWRETEQRAAAAYALGLLADERSLDPLVKVLDDRDVHPKVRGYVAEALANFDDVRVIDHLIDALRDPSVEVRYWAAFALGQLRSKKALPDLKKLLTDEAILPGWGKVSDAAQEAIADIEATNRISGD